MSRESVTIGSLNDTKDEDTTSHLVLPDESSDGLPGVAAPRRGTVRVLGEVAGRVGRVRLRARRAERARARRREVVGLAARRPCRLRGSAKLRYRY